MSACQHTRTRLIAKDKDAEYLECMDCGAILEAEEMPKAAAEKSSPESSTAEGTAEGQSSESLSDA